MSGTTISALGFLEARAGHVVRDYRRAAAGIFGPVVHSLVKPLLPAMIAGLVDGYVAQAGRRTVGLVSFARYPGIARITFCHVMPAYRERGIEEDLLAIVAGLLRDGGGPRGKVVCEIMMVSHADPDRIFAHLDFAVVPRMIMRAPIASPAARPPAEQVISLRGGGSCLVRGWARGDDRAAAEVIHDANTGALDGLIYPELLIERQAQSAVDAMVRGSSGPFDMRASGVAVDADSGRPVGVAVCSRPGGRHGFLTELAVARAWQGKGIGSALLDRALVGMASWRANAADLGVTIANAHAVRLYASRGFAPVSPFGAYYWPK